MECPRGRSVTSVFFWLVASRRRIRLPRGVGSHCLGVPGHCFSRECKMSQRISRRFGIGFVVALLLSLPQICSASPLVYVQLLARQDGTDNAFSSSITPTFTGEEYDYIVVATLAPAPARRTPICFPWPKRATRSGRGESMATRARPQHRWPERRELQHFPESQRHVARHVQQWRLTRIELSGLPDL